MLELPICTQRNESNGSFSCYKSYAAISFPGYVSIFHIDDSSKFNFLFNFKTNEQKYSQIRFNESEYCDDLVVSVFNENSLYIFSILQRKLLLKQKLNCTALVWDTLKPMSFLVVIDEHNLQYRRVEEETTVLEYDDPIQLSVKQIIIPPSHPNYLFALIESGTIYHYARSSVDRKYRFIANYFESCDDEKITGLCETEMEFFVMMTNHHIGYFSLDKLKSCWTICQTEEKNLAIITLPHYNNWIFLLLSFGDLIGIKYSLKNRRFDIRTNRFTFKSFNQNFVRNICSLDDKIFLFSSDFNIWCLSLEKKNKKYYICSKTLYRFPILSDMIQFINMDNLAFINSNNCFQIINYKTFETKFYFDLKKNQISSFKWICEKLFLFWNNHNILIFNMETLELKPIKISFEGREILEIKDIYIVGNFLFVKNNIESIIIIDVKTKFKYYYNLNEYLYFDVIKDRNLDFVFVLAKDNKDIYIFDHTQKLIYSINVSYKKVLKVVQIENTYAAYLNDGSLTIGNENKQLTFSTPTTLYQQNDIIVLCSYDQFEVFHNYYEPLAKFYYKNAEIIGINVNEIIFKSKDKIQIEYLNKPNQIKEDFQLSYNFYDPYLNRFNIKNLNKCLQLKARIMSFGTPFLDETSEILYFIGLKQEMYNLVDGEDPNRLFRNMFMNLDINKFSEEQLQHFKLCAESWEKNQRFVNSAVMYHSIKDYEKCAKNLLNMKMYNLVIYYCIYYGIENIKSEAILVYVSRLIKNGELLRAVAILLENKDYHFALSILYNNKMEKHILLVMKNIIKSKDNIVPSKFYTKQIDFDLIPFDLINQFSI